MAAAELAAKRAREAAERRQREYKAALANWRQAVTAREQCSQSGRGLACNAPLPGVPQMPPEERVQAANDPNPPAGPGAPPVVTLTAEEVALIAIARIKLTPPEVGIGPPPEINEWDMAAVGYPLWLWADGNTAPQASSDSVGGLSVGLNAKIDRIAFAMGDGQRVECAGVGKPWGRWVNPGTESPVCGYRYEKPSLPKGDYTVTMTTYWSVEWNAAGDTGTFSYPQTSSTNLPVGELQVLVR